MNYMEALGYNLLLSAFTNHDRDTISGIDIDDRTKDTYIKTFFTRLVRLPQGMILVTGPTGSGKSTTLYSALNLIR